MTLLTSRNNPKLKQVRQLLTQRKQRDSTGLFVAEGIRHVGEAVEAGAHLEYICYAPNLLTSVYATQLIQEQSQHGIPCYPVDDDTFSNLAGKDNPQGILAVVHQHLCSLSELTPRNFPWGVALVAPQDPGNIGTILRTIDAVGASGLVLLDDPAWNQYSADPYHPSAVRASMGAIFGYPVVKAGFNEFLPWEKAGGYRLVGTSAHAEQDYHHAGKLEPPLILLMGSEREGLTHTQSAACDLMVKIPMYGRVTSLNLAVATGIMLYALSDQII